MNAFKTRRALLRRIAQLEAERAELMRLLLAERLEMENRAAPEEGSAVLRRSSETQPQFYGAGRYA